MVGDVFGEEDKVGVVDLQFPSRLARPGTAGLGNTSSSEDGDLVLLGLSTLRLDLQEASLIAEKIKVNECMFSLSDKRKKLTLIYYDIHFDFLISSWYVDQDHHGYPH